MRGQRSLPLCALVLTLTVLSFAAASAAQEDGASLSLPARPPPRSRARPFALGTPPPAAAATASPAAKGPGGGSPSVCGASDLKPSSAGAVCQLVASWRLVDPSQADDDDAKNTGLESWACSAFRIGPRALATAGHCVFGKSDRYVTRYAESIEVYCGAASARSCASASEDGGRPSARGKRVLASPRWTSGPALGPSPYDWAVIETKETITGAASPLRLGAASGASARRVRLTGYPNQTPDTEAGGGGVCSSDAFEYGCRQFSSVGTLQTSLVDPRAPGFFVSSALDLCPGQSGGPVVDAGSGDVLAVVSGFNEDRCLNLFAAHAPEDAVDPATCERPSGGGVSVPCLWTRLTGERLRPAGRG